MSDSELKPGLNGRAIWLESLKSGALLVVLMLLISALLFYKANVARQPTTTVNGTVVSVAPYNMSNLSGNSSRVNVRLADGRNVEVLASGSGGQVFKEGQHVSIVENRHDNGRITYTLDAGKEH